MIRLLALLVVVPVVLVAARAAAADAISFDPTKPIAVNADSFVADLAHNTSTYTGNVVVSQGAIRMHADQVTVRTTAGKATSMDARGHVMIDSASGTATGDLGTYDVVDRVIHLNGNVVLTKGQSVLRGGALEVKIATGEARLLGSQPAETATTPAPAGRVQGLFLPSPKTPNSANP